MKANDYQKGRIVEIAKFKELEEKIKNILREYSLLKRQKQELEDSLKNKVSELEGVKADLNELTKERDAIRTRVDSLLNLLQDENINK